MITVTFIAGALPPNFCPIGWQNTFQGFVNALSGQINGLNYSQVIVSQTAPTTDLTNLWLQVTNQGVPVQLYSYSVTLGQWMPINQSWFFPGLIDSGPGAGAYIVTLPYLPISQTTGGVPTSGLVDGMTFLFKATNPSVTGVNTFQVKVGVSVTYASAPILYNGANLAANFMLTGGWYLVQYDGTNFQLLNPNINAVIPPYPVIPPIAFAKLYSTPQVAISGGSFPQITPHGLASVPAFVRGVIVCITADGIYVPTDEIDVGMFSLMDPASGSSAGAQNLAKAFYFRANNTDIISEYRGATFYIYFGANPNYQVIDPTKWNYKCYYAE